MGLKQNEEAWKLGLDTHKQIKGHRKSLVHSNVVREMEH